MRRARTNGLTVRAWNRGAAKAQALAAQDSGVIACASVAQAVQGAERIHLSLADDASVDAVLEPLMARKDLRLMVEEAPRVGQRLKIIPALAALLDDGIARGEGGLDVAAAVRVPG